MASISLGLRCTQPVSLSNSRGHVGQRCRLHTRRARTGVCGVVTDSKAKEWQRLKQLFNEAYDRCHTNPTQGVPFTPEEFYQAVEDDGDIAIELGDKVKGIVYVDKEGEAYADIGSKALARLPIDEVCLYEIDHVFEAGLVNGLQEEFIVIEKDLRRATLTVSLKELQQELAWERCRQLQVEDVVVMGKICDGNRGGAVVFVEGLRGFVPFSQISMTLDEDELIDMELPLKFVEVDEEIGRLILSNRKAVADSQAQLGIGSVVAGVVQSLKPYGAFVDIGGINGLLHVSQISHDRVSDIETVLQPGDELKVMVLSHDRERGRVSLSTKKLEPNPGDMIRNPKLVFEKAEEMAQIFRQRIAYAEAVARADMLRFQPESGLSLSSDGILGPLTPTSSNGEDIDPTNTPSAKDSDTSSQRENPEEAA